jgi:hypothetical protein
MDHRQAVFTNPAAPVAGGAGVRRYTRSASV